MPVQTDDPKFYSRHQKSKMGYCPNANPQTAKHISPFSDRPAAGRFPHLLNLHPRMKQLRAVYKYFWKYRIRLSIGLLFVFISNYFSVLTPQIAGYVIDFVQRNLNLPGYQGRPNATAGYDLLVRKLAAWLNQTSFGWQEVVAICGAVILVLALLRGFFLFLMRQTIIVMSRHIEYDQKNEIYEHYQRLDLPFYKRNSTGDLMNRIAEDVSRVRMFTGPAIMYLANLIAVISLSVYFMLMRDAMLTLYVLAPLPILAVAIYFVNNSIHRKSEKIQEALSDLTTNAQESYAGIRVIKSFVQEKSMLNYFTKNSERYRESAIGLAKVEAIYFPSITLLIGLSTLLTIMIGGLYYISGQHQIGVETIVEFVMYVNMLTFPVSAIGLTASMIQRAAASQKRINAFLETQPAIRNAENPLPFRFEDKIEFRQVDLVYPDTGIRALNEFNLEIKKGEKIALVGRTGSGKTTLAQVLLRMMDPVRGSILIDSVDLKKIDLEALREQFSYVPQDVFLFSDSVQNNISFGVSEASRERVETAARMAVVHDDILGFSNGYDTAIGERGVTLSGGQKQRISIARALIKDPAMVILDDCLSAVDARTEQAIISNLRTFLQDKTAIIITHRIFALMDFDRIIVLDQGKIVESGTHAQLLASGGYYATLYTRQQEGESSGSD